MSVGPVLYRGRRLAESLMVDQCTIRRQTGIATDPDTGAVAPTYEVVYSGKCKVQTFTNRELVKSGGLHEFINQRYEVDIPVSAVGVLVNDEITLNAATYDADLAGRRYRVVGLMNKSLGTARRLGVEEMVA
jgi:hypothetical protein